MDISPDLARLNRDRFRAFADVAGDQMPPARRRWPLPGTPIRGLEAASLDADELAWAQEHLRILSGLYGLLRPLDAIQPYRLEMGSRLKTRRGKSLYDYWRDSLSKALNTQAQRVGTDVLVNCASQEYFGAVARKALKLRVITPVFMEDKGGTPRIVSFFAKKARGAMARFIVQNRLTDPAGLTDFDSGGYAFSPTCRNRTDRCFARPYNGCGSASASSERVLGVGQNGLRFPGRWQDSAIPLLYCGLAQWFGHIVIQTV